MFQLKKEEFDNLRSQIVTSSSWGGRQYLPYAFTENGHIQEAVNKLNGIFNLDTFWTPKNKNELKAVKGGL